ncbi:cilia- and flagella-associated protein 36 isoform X2 [Diabrotica virgifera virgifera]|uniref:Cilia- and flagella-associated protein 36 n=1 Tax=Diabrotica virgifera virgifera TaxID=50390 RepID=A0ABM5KEK0_DIAVI|nr:cilia- and flagella-associated protein 36 isoform X2 [Diabrotica virgifera virgifera]
MEEDNSWVFDSLVTFLNGPIWNAPLQSFIEEKSLIFEPSAEDNEEHQKIFEEFKNLVDFMLGTFMEDIGITSEQFENACKESKKYHVAFDPNSFEQVWAANDYDMFKKMMAQRNVELQLQALELIERKCGRTPQSFIPTSKTENVQEIPVTIEKSVDLEHNVMEEVSKNFTPDSEEPSSSLIKPEIILEEKEILEKALEEAKGHFIHETPKIPQIKETPPVKKEENNAEEKESLIKLENEKKKVDAIELKKRQEYLRAQRDKLVALKKEARKKQLDSGDTKSKGRPRSARAAEAVLTGEKSDIEPQQLQLRKALAERLRAEVVATNK